MKKGRLFATIVYFIFTFGIGIIFAITLPHAFLSFSAPSEYIVEKLQDGQFYQPMTLIAGCFNDTPVYQDTFDNGSGVVLYESVMQFETDDPAEGEANGSLYRTYMGFLYGAKSYSVYSADGNRTALFVTDVNGNRTEIPILDYDTNNDGNNDGLSTVEQYGFVVLDIPQTKVDSIASLDFVDKDGNSLNGVINVGTLDFQGDFFALFDRLDEFNELVARFATTESDSEKEELNKTLTALFNEMTDEVATHEGYTVVSDADPDCATVRDEIVHRANKKAIPYIVVYFVVIYVIADFLLGSHFIIKFFRWFLFKVCKIPHKEKKSPKKEEVFGHDYYSMVTLSLDVTEVPDFSGSVEIKYTNSDAEVKFTLLRSEGYKATQRIKAGVYVNPFIDIDRNYAPTDLPDNLEVEGYRVEKTVKIVRRTVASEQPESQLAEQACEQSATQQSGQEPEQSELAPRTDDGSDNKEN